MFYRIPTPLLRQILRASLAWVCVGLGLHVASGFWDDAAYAFAAPVEPLLLGDVKALLPEQIPHNAYVELHGITEHRGLRQTDLRGLTFKRREMWVLRLLGSRGTFIQVAPDADKFGPATEVKVRGRAVDPAQAPKYATLLRQYDSIFAVDRRQNARVIEADMRPGVGRTPYLVALLFLVGLLGLALFKTWALITYLRRSA